MKKDSGQEKNKEQWDRTEGCDELHSSSTQKQYLFTGLQISTEFHTVFSWLKEQGAVSIYENAECGSVCVKQRWTSV